MTILVAIETVLLAFLGLLVAGLLRSHAEILRRLDGRAPEPGGLPAELPPLPAKGLEEAHDVVGETLAGDPMKVAVTEVRGATLLAFLSSGCLGCESFWEAFRDPRRRDVPGDARLVIVTKDPSFESLSRLMELAPTDVPLVMSSAAWEAYRVAGSPYFVLVDGPSGRVRGEGTATAWPQVESLLRDAQADLDLRSKGNGGAARLARADAELALAGIGPGHPSLYATGGNGSEPSAVGNGSEAAPTATERGADDGS